MGNYCSCGHSETDRPSSHRPVRRQGHGNAAGGAMAAVSGGDDLILEEEFPYQNQFTFTSLFPYLESGNVRWDGEYSTWSYSQLKKKRMEFWDTRVVGNAEMWCALKLSVEMINQLEEKVKNGDTVAATERVEQLATCEAILDSAALTKFSLNNSEKNTLHCYDRLGVKYDLPFFLFVLPKNLLKHDAENEKLSNSPDSKGSDSNAANHDDEKKRDLHASVLASSTQANAANDVSAMELSSLPSASNTPGATSRASLAQERMEDKEKFSEKDKGGDREKEKGHRDPNQMKLKFRFSNGLSDCSAYFSNRTSIGELKKFLEKERKVTVEKQIIFFQGKRYADQLLLSNCPFKSGIILQVMIKG